MDVERILIVEDNRALLRSLMGSLAEFCSDVRGCRTLLELRETLRDWQPDVVLLDVVLPDGDARQAVELLGPKPVVLAMSGEADPDVAFTLGQCGVRTFLPKPVTLEKIRAAIDQATTRPPDLNPTLRRAVGRIELGDVEAQVRRVMIREALERAGGSRRGAARLLGVSRQLLQYLLRRLD